jgi:FMN phosphatase YigB (HAD superfamily)
MVQAVVLGLAGVFDTIAALRAAEVAAFAEWIVARGGHRAAVLDAIASGGPRWRSAALRAAGLSPQSRLACEATLQAGSALPHTDRAAALAWIEPIRGSLPIALLDSGPLARLDAWSEAIGLGGAAGTHLWTASLGQDAAPPRPLAFRWLAKRLDVPAHACLYVAGRPECAQAAQAAGWQRVLLAQPLDPGFDWRAVLRGEWRGR